MTMNRRTFNTSLIALGLGMMLPGHVRAAGAKSGFLSTGYDQLQTRHLVSRIGPDLDIIWDLPLPARGHGTAVRPGNDEGLVVARRPGEFAIIFGLSDGKERFHLTPAPGRHFYGHGVYSLDGKTLWMTENAFESGVGVIEDEKSVDGVVALGYDEDTVKRIWKLLDRAEYKRRQAPPGVKITERAFGKDRRYPITNGFTKQI